MSDEREAIIRYLNEEADDAMAYYQKFGETDLSTMGVMRAGYYRQAAAFIKRGEHMRTDRPRPSWALNQDQPA